MHLITQLRCILWPQCFLLDWTVQPHLRSLLRWHTQSMHSCHKWSTFCCNSVELHIAFHFNCIWPSICSVDTVIVRNGVKRTVFISHLMFQVSWYFARTRKRPMLTMMWCVLREDMQHQCLLCPLNHLIWLTLLLLLFFKFAIFWSTHPSSTLRPPRPNLGHLLLPSWILHRHVTPKYFHLTIWNIFILIFLNLTLIILHVHTSHIW